MVNENSSILSLLLLVSQIISANVCIIVYIDILYVGSTHLHGIRADRLLSKSYTKMFCKYKRLKTAERWISKTIHSYTLQLLCMEGENNDSYINHRIVQVNLEYKYRTDISHRKIQVFKSHG
jgi:hypothetical protein